MSAQRTVVITMGDPKGIGPEVVCKALLHKKTAAEAQFLILGYEPAFKTLPQFSRVLKKKNVQFICVGDTITKPLKQLTSKDCGTLAFCALEMAVMWIKGHPNDAMVTAPINKANMKLAGFRFPGHTEYLCKNFKVLDYAMMLFHKKLKVVLTTIHMPLNKVSWTLDPNLVLSKIKLTADVLRDGFGIRRPKIAVCGLNPHASEGGLFGDEEKTKIEPAIKKFGRLKNYKHVSVKGPLAADSVFHFALKGDYDAVLCQYHDQGLIPLKTTGFDDGVNLTLGLPFIRTSPDHGTAFDIAGKDMASPKSMQAAIDAAKMLKAKRK